MAFSLELPKEEEIREEVKAQSKPSEEQLTQIEGAVSDNVRHFLDVDLDDVQSRHDCVAAIEQFGMETLERSESKNAILQKRMYQFTKAGGESGEVSKGLTDLTIRMRDLDPSKVDFLKTGKLGKIFNPARRYFERYRTADAEIAEIITSLDRGKKTLENDNTTLELEQLSMRQTTKQLAQNLEIGEQMDAALEQAISQMTAEDADAEKVRFLQEEVLYPLRQRVQDFQQLLVVDQQGIIAMEIIRRNNRELIRSVERAKLVTVQALRTAVTVAGALYDQKIVLEKVQALNAETERMIAATGTLLREQGAAVQKQASEASISAETLQQAFRDALQALDDISAYRQEALPRIKASVDTFKTMADEGEKRIKALEEGAT